MGGWATPNEVDTNILKEELEIAVALCDCDLQDAGLSILPVGLSSELKEHVPEWARRQGSTFTSTSGASGTSTKNKYEIAIATSGEGASRTVNSTPADMKNNTNNYRDDTHHPAETTKNNSGGVTALELLALIVSKTIGDPLPGHRRAWMLVGIVLPFFVL
ncbi:unnamed protein product [Amoebophrya sp. A25]|nr:unnamed protein product [Amoebophrya sp. A25]|eukprot:GSA25T00024878001.1